MKKSSYRTFNGGPEQVIKPKKSSARRRGLKPSGEPHQVQKARVILQNGVIIDPHRFRKINPTLPVFSAASTTKPAKTLSREDAGESR